MKEFDQIWLFIEQILNVEVPSYLKNILHACGYNNGITIASIDNKDIRYFEDETRNGNVVRFFNYHEDVDEDDDDDKDVDEVESVLKGQVFPAAKFEFNRGHEKLLLSIANYLKEYMKENGPNNFILKGLPKKKTAKETTKDIVRKVSRKRKVTLDDPLIDSALAEFAHIEEHSEELLNEAMKKHKKTLLNKTMVALRSNTEELVAQNVELIKLKIANDLVVVHIADDKKWGYAAAIGCPYCDDTTNVFQTSSEAWGTSNFDRHLKLMHPKDRPSNTVNQEIAAITGNSTDNENGNIDTVDEGGKTVDVPPKEKQKKELKKAFNEEINATLQRSKEKAILPNKVTKSFALKVNDEADKIARKEQKKQSKKASNEENDGTLQTSKEKAILPNKATKSIALKVNDEAVKIAKKEQKKKPKKASNEENDGNLQSSKEKAILPNKATKSIILKVNDEAVKIAKKEQKKKLKKASNEENDGNLQSSKEKAILPNKATKSIALKVNDEAVKITKKDQKKHPKKASNEENETDAMPPKKKQKKQLKAAFSVENNGSLQTSNDEAVKIDEADEKKCVKSKAKLSQNSSPQKQQKKQLEKNWRKYW